MTGSKPHERSTPEKDLVIFVLSNLSGAPVKKLNKKIFERVQEAGVISGRS